MSSRDSLVDIPAEEFSSLRDKFKVDWPKHICAFSLFNTLARRFENNSESGKLIKVLSLNEDWSDGTFIAMFERNVSFGTLDPYFDRLKRALRLVDYSQLKFFMCIPRIYVSMFNDVIKESKLEVKFDIPGNMVHMRKEDAKQLEIEIPQNFRLGQLSPDHAQLIKNAWTHGSEFSANTVAYLIANNKNIGLFDESDTLVAWCLTFDFGSLAALQVEEAHMRKGFGSLVTKAITKKIAEEFDVDVTYNYVNGNLRSQLLAEKIGFKKIDDNQWIGVTSGVE